MEKKMTVTEMIGKRDEWQQVWQGSHGTIEGFCDWFADQVHNHSAKHPDCYCEMLKNMYGGRPICDYCRGTRN